MRQNPAADLAACSLFLQSLILFGIGIRMLSFLTEGKFYLIYSFLLTFFSALTLFVGIGLLRRRLYSWIFAILLQVSLLICSVFSLYFSEVVRIPAGFLAGFTLLLCGASRTEILSFPKETL